MKYILITFLLFGFAACKPEINTRFTSIPAEKAGIGFVNQITENDSLNVLEFTNIYTGGGVAAGDLNQDGNPDLFFGGNQVSSRLYLNQSGKHKIRFRDITEIAGTATDRWITGVTIIDIDQDGRSDIYACVSGSRNGRNRENLLFLNQGNNDEGIPVFRESAAEFNLNDSSYTTQAAFFDYDLDGDLDVFMIVNLAENYYGGVVNIPVKEDGRHDLNRIDRLYRNNFREKAANPSLPPFSDVTLQSGITEEGYSLGIGISDLNRDGWPDVYIANDFLSNEVLYINNQDGSFTNRAADYFSHTSFAGMGTDLADYNNDGYTDVVVADMVPEKYNRLKSMSMMANYDKFIMQLQNGYQAQFSRNSLQLNLGQTPDNRLIFSEIGQLANIHHTDWSWSVLLADYDNDGWKDLYVTNGFLRDLQDLDFIHYVQKPERFQGVSQDKQFFLDKAHQLPGIHEPNYFFRNQGDLTFQDVSPAWSSTGPSYSHGALYSDLDQDGDLDLVVSNVNESPFILQNHTVSPDSSAANFLQVLLEGPAGNRQAIGSQVRLVSGAKQQWQEHYLSRGFQSGKDELLHFGLGNSKSIDTLEIQWPDGKISREYHTAANQLVRFSYGSAEFIDKEERNAPEITLFSRLSPATLPAYRHREYHYTDFHYERWLPHKLSQNGPGLAAADVNGDGLQDFYVGGSRFQPGTLFIAKGEGFQLKHLEKDNHVEDQAGLFFDADLDGDPDLYVVSGSNEMGYENPAYQDRLYLNDGRGNFTRHAELLPEFQFSGSCVEAADFDQDGDLDLFVGSRVLPGRYPLPATSVLLRNELGQHGKPQFRRVEVPEFEQLGLVTDGLWTDVDQDGWVDLLVVGEWMPLIVFYNEQGTLGRKTNRLPDSEGWWNSITGGDFDNDGDIDYVAGNLGLNSRYKASVQEPVSVYAEDFDGNGSLDPVMSYFLKGVEVPTHTRDEFIEQMISKRKHFQTYAAYAQASLEDIFTRKALDSAYRVKAVEFRSVYLENRGGAEGFVLKPLPHLAQVSTILGMAVRDFDHDGNLDLLITGNTYGTDLDAGWYDASPGFLVKGDGRGNFSVVKPAESGFVALGDTKALAELVSEHQNLVVVSTNNDSLQVFQAPSLHSRLMFPEPLVWQADVRKDGKLLRKKEFYYGSSYYGQSNRYLDYAADEEVILIGYDGTRTGMDKLQTAGR